ncbi:MULTISPECIES: MFS transporter [Streptacidiphilus]|uniref:MFS transporter n=1 Tax=Streptacidiphilus cavernicola TaxID=3342716 RepID=A0ABV6UJ48_9ACTN|nr:MFS transporter [Streptacidiphilus jeojiense]
MAQTTAPAVARSPGGPDTRNRAVLVVVCLANFLVLADATIVNVALPTIRTALRLSPLGLPWVVNSYTFAFGGFLLLGGYAADRLGPRRVFTAGMVLFALGSVVCGLAGSSAELVAGRTVQGVGGAFGCPAALSVVTLAFPGAAEHTRALAGWSAAGAGAIALGPMIGGVLTGVLGWWAVFLVPVPLCLGAAVAGWRLLPDGGPAGNPRKERSGRPPGRLPVLRLTGADTVLALTSAALVAVGYTSTLWVQTILHCGPVQAGLAFLPLSGGILLGAGAAPGLVRRFGVRGSAVGGLVVAVAGLAPLSRLPAGAGLPQLLPWLGLLAFGFGVQSVPVSVVATAVPGHEAVASAAYQTAGQFGGGIGLALLSGLAAGRTAGSHAAGNAALASGYDAAFGGGALLLAAAALVALVLLRPAERG